MKKNEIEKDSENSIYILGSGSNSTKKGRNNKAWKIYVVGGLIIMFIIIVGVIIYNNQKANYLYEPENSTAIITDSSNNLKSSTKHGFIEVKEETVNDVPLLIYVPHNAHPELQLEQPKQTDTKNIFVAYAADIRADNYQIVGDFVVAGKQIARGQRKKGFCAIIGNEVVIGSDEDTPYLDKAIKEKGYFFRQYPLVINGKMVENEPKGKSIRRAIAMLDKQMLIVESRSRESFYDFAQALVDIGISDAIYLVSGDSFGWYYTETGEKLTFGVEKPNTSQNVANCIVWRSN